MPFIPGGFAHVAVELRLENDPDPMYITYGVEVNSLELDVANDLHAAFVGNMLAVIGSDYSAVSTTLITDNIAVTSQTGSFPGEDNAASCPSNCAMLVKKVSGFRGRANTGRMYIPGISEGNVENNGALTTGQLTVAQAAVSDWYAAIFGVEGVDDLVILHSTEALGAPTPVVALQVQPVIATQRRRMR